MKKIERRIAFYDDGTQKDFKGASSKIPRTRCIGIVKVYGDGSRELEYKSTKKATSVKNQIAFLQLQANLEYKYDGGDTPEIQQLKKDNRYKWHTDQPS